MANVPLPQDASPPALALIIAIGGQRERAARALRSLLEQNVIEQMEILLYDLGPRDCPPLPGSDHPCVRMTRQTPQDLLSVARVHGIRSARAPVVWFMEEHCEMQPGAAEAMIRAHEGPWAGVGCDFINANPDSGRSNQAFRMNYGRYLPPHNGRGPTRYISGQNSAFKRDVLLRYNDRLEFMMNTDLVLQFKMKRDGYQLFYEPAAKISHRNENSFPSLCTGVFYWNWCFSHVRAATFEWSLPRKVLRIALAPLIPWWRLAKIFVWTSRLGSRELVQLLRDIPFVIGVSYCAIGGQVAGLLNKIDQASHEFSHFEMNEPRLLRSEVMS
jgi:hypothetical protein